MDYFPIYPLTVAPPKCWDDELMQQEGPDFAQQRVCRQWAGTAGRGRQHRLLALPGGGRGPAPEPEYGGPELPALRPLACLLPGW